MEDEAKARRQDGAGDGLAGGDGGPGGVFVGLLELVVGPVPLRKRGIVVIARRLLA